MVRDGDQWRTVSWDEAFARCEELIAGVMDRHGKEALTAYVGNPTAHNFSLGRYVGLFIGLADFPMIYSAGTVDQWPKNVSCALMYGNMWSIPTPDLTRTDYLVVMGANPQASQGSLLAVADILGEIDAIARARRQDGRDRPAAHRHGRPRARSGCRSSPAPTPRSSSRSATCCSPKGSSTSATSPTS